MILRYNYTRDDEEIYKEVMEIANELIPHIIKVVSSQRTSSILKDPECFAYLLQFYDGICQWEEDSQTPVLHIGWAKPLVNTISKFDFDVRGQVVILENDLSNEDYENTYNVKQNVTRFRSDKLPFGNNTDSISNFIVNNSKEYLKNEMDSRNLHPDIRELTAACGEKLLNRDFLIQGGGEPFIGGSEILNVCSSINNENDLLETVYETSRHPKIIFSSEKMKGLKNLLLGEKLNTHAISLQLTAQSQVQVGGSKKSVFRDPLESTITIRSKRSRRE